MNKAELGIPKLTILPDRPDAHDIIDRQHDTLAFNIRLSALFDVLRHKDTACPVSLAIYGDWGSGKTSAMRWLFERLEPWNQLNIADREGHPKVHPVWIEPWRYRTRGDLLKGLVFELILSCLSLPGLPPADAYRLSVDAGEKFSPILGMGFLYALQEMARKLNPEIKAAEHEKNFTGRNITLLDCPGAPCMNIFEATLKNWISGCLQCTGGEDDTERLAVFINDLDHCTSEVTLEVFEMIRLYLDCPELVFVVGLDRKVVDEVLLNHYKEHGIGAEKSLHYLNKIFQAELYIEPSSIQIEAFYYEHVQNLDKVCGGFWSQHLSDAFRPHIDKALMHLAKNNPREIKLLLNSALIHGYASFVNEASPQKNVSEAGSLRFAQGVQVYLLQRWLANFSTGAAAFCSNEVQDWFLKLSEEACKPNTTYKAVISGRRMAMDSGTAVPPRPGSAGYNSDSRLTPPEGLSFNLIHEWVWDLLKIPFSKEVAITCAEEGTAPQTLEHKGVILFTGFNTIIKDAIASVLEIPVAEISDADLVKVTTLDLSGTKIVDADLSALAHLRNLEWLELYNTGIKSIDVLKLLPNLKGLNISGTGVGKVDALAGLTRLERLDLSCTGVHSIGVLQNLENLQRLQLYQTNVTDLKSLASLKNLERLNLSFTKVSDQDIQTIGNLSNLRELFLRGVNVTPIQVAHIQDKIGYSLRIHN